MNEESNAEFKVQEEGVEIKDVLIEII